MLSPSALSRRLSELSRVAGNRNATPLRWSVAACMRAGRFATIREPLGGDYSC
jgi:hypothetical protein